MTTSTHPHQRGQADAVEHLGLRRDAFENRRRLLEAARVVFAEHGLQAGVEEIAQSAGVGIGTLYRRFPTKEALIAELVRELLQEVVTKAEEAQQVPDGHGLEQFVYAMGEAQTANRGCIARIWTDQNTTELRKKYRAALAILLSHAKTHNTIRADAALTDLDLLFWSFRGIIETTGDASTTAWRRQAAIALAGLRPSHEPLNQPAITNEIAERARNLATSS